MVIKKEIKMDKKALRRKMLQRRGLLPEEERLQLSHRIAKMVEQHPDFILADTVLVFVGYASEVCTDEMIRNSLAVNKKVYVPKVMGTAMDFFRIHGLDDCEAGFRGILEPKTTKEPYVKQPGEKALMLLPGLAFDEAGHRLGYGGGFYDRYLMEHHDIVKMGIGFEFQMTKYVPTDKFDQVLDFFVSEKKVRHMEKGK